MNTYTRSLKDGSETIVTSRQRQPDRKPWFFAFAVKVILMCSFIFAAVTCRVMYNARIEALNKEATYGLADEMDKHIAGMAATREAVKYAASATAITKDNVLGEIDKALEKLYGNNVRPNGKIMMEVPPWFYMRLKQAYTALDTDNSKMLENGRVGKYGNVIVKMSNNVAVDSSANSLITVHTDKAVAFVNPMTHVEAYRPEKGFSDAVKGFVLYQAKIVRPKELVVLNCKAGA